MHIACVTRALWTGSLKSKFYLKGWRSRSCCGSKGERDITRHCRACRDGARANRNRRKDSTRRKISIRISGSICGPLSWWFVQRFAVGVRQRVCRAGRLVDSRKRHDWSRKRLKRERGRRRRRGALRQRLLVAACNTNAHTLLTSLSLHSYLTRIKVVCSLSARSLQARLWCFLCMPKCK